MDCWLGCYILLVIYGTKRVGHRRIYKAEAELVVTSWWGCVYLVDNGFHVGGLNLEIPEVR